MRRLASALMGSALAASFVIASLMPLNAAPLYLPKPTGVSADVEPIHYRGRYGRRGYGRPCYNCGRGYYGGRHYYRPYYRPYYRSYYRPYYRYYRPYYRPFYPYYPYRPYYYPGYGGLTLYFSF
jgi:hypothetical protein